MGEIELKVNRAILSNIPRKRTEESLDSARKHGALAFFGDKYGAKVFVVGYGEASTEVCGGTHCLATGDIGLFLITSESSVASGVRRIEAVAGEKALDLVQSREKIIQAVSEKLKSPPSELPEKIDKIFQKQGELENEISGLNRKNRGAGLRDFIARARAVPSGTAANGSLKIVAEEIESSDAESLREAADAVRDQLGSGVVILAASREDRTSFVVTLTKDCLTRGLNAGAIAKEFAREIDGSGGGKDSFAQGGGKAVPDLKKVLDNFSVKLAATISTRP